MHRMRRENKYFDKELNKMLAFEKKTETNIE